MKLICITHWRLPSEKTLSPYIMRVCEAFARQRIEVELWAPRRFNPQFESVDPFLYHLVEKNFRIERLPVLDGMRFLPGRGGFFLMVASFTLALFFKIAFMPDRGRAIFYFHDIRDAWTTILLSRNVFSEILMYYKSSADFVNRWCFFRMCGFIFTTRAVMEHMRSDYGVDPGRMLYAPCAVNFTRFGIETSKEVARAKLGLPQDERIVLYAGHLFSSKGVDTLLEAAPFLSEEGIVYFVGGTDEDIAKFRNKATQAIRTHPNVPNGQGKIIERELSYKLGKVFFEAHDSLGRFCRERQYADLLEKKLTDRGFNFKRELAIETAGRKSNFADFVVENRILIEVKAKPFIGKDEYFQVMRYLEALDLELALIVNFRNKYLKPHRVLNPKYSKRAHLVNSGDNLDSLGRVSIVGRRGHEEIPLWLRAADVLVIPNTAKEDAAKYESSPSKLFEYMASGRPIVASDVPAIRDVFDESMGYFFKPDNAASLVAAIRRVFADRRRAEEKAKRARVEAQKYSWEERAASIKGFIEERTRKAS